MSMDELNMARGSSHSSLHSANHIQPGSLGLASVPAVILPRPGLAAHTATPAVSTEARDLSVMGINALASVQGSAQTLTGA